jgi:hypothetical protein
VAGEQNYYSCPASVGVKNPWSFASILSKYLTGIVVTEADSLIEALSSTHLYLPT